MWEKKFLRTLYCSLPQENTKTSHTLVGLGGEKLGCLTWVRLQQSQWQHYPALPKYVMFWYFCGEGYSTRSVSFEEEADQLHSDNCTDFQYLLVNVNC